MIIGDIPEFNLDTSPIYELPSGKRVNRKEAVRYIEKKYGKRARVNCYNVTCYDDLTDIFILTTVEGRPFGYQ